MSHPKKLLVLDIDNTVFNWVAYYTQCVEAMLTAVGKQTGLSLPILYAESRTVFEREGSIEYPFLIQELPSVISHYGSDIDRLLTEAVESGRQAFNKKAREVLQPYPDVVATLQLVKARYPEMPIVALTDAPRYVAMWKLNKLGLLTYFDAVYGLADPRVPADLATKKIKVDPEILIKHLQKSSFDFAGRIRILPDDYEKPGTKGLKTVLMDFEMEDHLKDVLWVGDNLRKDVGLGKRLGVHTAWAKFGTVIAPEAKELLLAFSPLANVAKNVSLDPLNLQSPQPDFVLEGFVDLFVAIESCFGSP